MKIRTGVKFAIGAVILLTAMTAWNYWELKHVVNGVVDDFGGDLTRLWNKAYFNLGSLPITPSFLFKTLLFFAFLYWFARKGGEFLRRQLLDRTSLDEGQKYAIQRSAMYLLFVIGGLVGLDTAGINLASLAVFGGAVGIGIGFGLQAIASNFVSGLILLLERPIKVGDRVQAENLNGDVIRIGARATWIRTNDNIVVIVPNSDFIAKPVINWTAVERQVRFSIPLGVSYGSDPQQVREVLMEAARRDPDVLDSPPPDVVFTEFGDSSLNFELRVWTRTKIQMPNVLRSNLYFEVFRAFREHNIEIPFPQRDLHLRSVDVPLPISRPEQAS